MEFEDYVRTRRGALFGFAVVLTADPVLADDIVSDVLGRAFEQWQRVSAVDNVHAYVRRMVLNQFLSWRRRRQRTSPWGDMSAIAGTVGDPGDAHAEQQLLLGELRALPARQRAALVLRFYEGMSFAEIAQLLGTGENAVRSNVSRALSRLRITLSSPVDDDRDRFPRPAVEA
jgi:RNA polymerase sigma-70 factor (sigma-E family)